MATVSFDFENPDTAKKYPRHGWALNSQGARLLWFPIRGLMWDSNIIREAKNAPVLAGFDRQRVLAFNQTISNLAVTLREIGKLTREGLPSPFETQDTEQHERWTRANELLPVHVEGAILILRRLADLLVNAIGPVLFERPGAVTPKFKDLHKALWDEKEISKLRLICDPKTLRDAFIRHSSWFDTLRHPEGGHKGVRDAVEHDSVRMDLTVQGINDEPRRFVVSLVGHKFESEITRDLLNSLQTMVCDFCEWPQI